MIMPNTAGSATAAATGRATEPQAVSSMSSARGSTDLVANERLWKNAPLSLIQMLASLSKSLISARDQFSPLSADK
jgi:hypothetical protein